MKLFLNLIFLLSLVQHSYSAEESVDLDSVETVSVRPPVLLKENRFSLMGRVDLTSEWAETSPSGEKKHNLENNHFFVFLKAKASEKVSFLGEIANRSFFSVQYIFAESPFEFEFGKVVVPFGNTRRFHHFYGGIQGYGATGVMLPNFWAESGMIFRMNRGPSQWEAYWVDSIRDDSTTLNPSLQSGAEPRNIQAVGVRWSGDVGEKYHGIVSVYRGEYQAGKAVEILGLDMYSDYGGSGWDHFRWSWGLANAWLRKAPVSGDFQKRGDYFELLTNYWGPGEVRLRYGTYIDNDKVESSKDVHNLNLGYIMPIDAMRILAEYQWNFEAINEIPNDLLRVMMSLDF